jgi:hypothetical protein
MRKRTRAKFTDELMETWLAAGKGQGEGELYKPWLNIYDFASMGQSTIIPSVLYNRGIHVFSLKENYHLKSRHFLKYPVTKEYEQFPLLPREHTQLIAKSLNIKHPTDPRSRIPIVMTSDLFYSVQTEKGAIDIVEDVKTLNELNKSKRTIEKLEITRRYWLDNNKPWRIWIIDNLPKDYLFNCKILYPYIDLTSFNIPTDEFIAIKLFLDNHLEVSKQSLTKLTSLCDKEIGVQSGQSLTIAYHLIASRYWITNLTQKIIVYEAIDLKLKSETHIG